MDDNRDQWIASARGADGTPLTDPGIVRLLAHAAGFACEDDGGGAFLVQPYDPAKDEGIRQICEHGGQDLDIEVPNMGTLEIAGFQ